MPCPPDLHQSLEMLARVMAPARAPWWVIGSAAVCLHGAQGVVASDVDVVLSVEDAQHILPGLGVALTPGRGDDRFRSDYYCQWPAPPVPVDFMAGFHVRGALLRPVTREPAPGVAGIFLPSRQELLAMLHDFARPKDLARATLLAAAIS